LSVKQIYITRKQLTKDISRTYGINAISKKCINYKLSIFCLFR